jgi:hypothetical protein
MPAVVDNKTVVGEAAAAAPAQKIWTVRVARFTMGAVVDDVPFMEMAVDAMVLGICQPEGNPKTTLPPTGMSVLPFWVTVAVTCVTVLAVVLLCVIANKVTAAEARPTGTSAPRMPARRAATIKNRMIFGVFLFI